MIIYAPQIDNTVPAFTNQTIKIKFKHNIGVGSDEVKSMKLQIKTMNSLKSYNNVLTADSVDLHAGIAEFKFPTDLNGFFKPKNYYKFQIAYSDDDGSDLAWSAAAVGRYIENAPVININNWITPNTTHKDNFKYQGNYTHSFEQLYKYRYTFIHSRTDTIQTSGWIQEQTIKEIFNVKHRTTGTEVDMLKLEIITVNGYEQTLNYHIVERDTLASSDNDFPFSLEAKTDSELGLITLSLKPNQGGHIPPGNYELVRSSDGINWEVLTTVGIEVDAENQYKDTLIIYYDNTIMQDEYYTYRLYRYSINDDNEIYYSKTYLETIGYCDFEDAFLTDGVKILPIKFNPKISSFKNTILESKQDTIGGKYPIFFRNGDVKYKEIPISGLISYQMDAREKFMTDEELGLEKNLGLNESTRSAVAIQRERSTQLTGSNIAAERRFKLAVLDWLNNGQPKYFRSPTEGNYVLRLLNISLSPNDTLGRMLHTFSATGYECAENTIEKLQELGLSTRMRNKSLGTTLTEKQVQLGPNGTMVVSGGTYTNIKYEANNVDLNKNILKLDDQPFRIYTNSYEVPSNMSFHKIEATAGKDGATISYTPMAQITYDGPISGYENEVDLEKKIVIDAGNLDLKDGQKLLTLLLTNNSETYTHTVTIDDVNIILPPKHQRFFGEEVIGDKRTVQTDSDDIQIDYCYYAPLSSEEVTE